MILSSNNILNLIEYCCRQSILMDIHVYRKERSKLVTFISVQNTTLLRILSCDIFIA